MIVRAVSFIVGSLAAILLTLRAAQAEPFRTTGYELLEAAVMEADAVLDVRQTSIERASVITVLYGYDLLGFDVTEGTRIELKDFPVFDAPLFDGPGRDAAFIREPHKRSRRQNRSLRGLAFLQREKSESYRRYSDQQAEHKDGDAVGKREFAPRVVIGNDAFSWWASHTKDSRRGSLLDDALWDSMAIVEDLSVGQLRPFRRRMRSFEGNFLAPPTASRYRTRRYELPQELRNWEGIRNRLRAAVNIRNRFNLARGRMKPEERREFYLSMIQGEKIYANYALEDLAASSDRGLAEALMALIPKLYYYVDDTWETALRIALKQDSEPKLPLLTRFVELAEAFTDKECRAKGEGRTLFEEAAKRFGRPTASAHLGFLDADKVLALLFRLYEAELKCYLVSTGTTRGDLIPPRSKDAYGDLLGRGTNSGLTLDELGILGPLNPFSARRLREHQKSLYQFKPVFTLEAISQIASVPTGLRELLSYCAYGLENYEKVGLPDLTLGAHVVWKLSCDQLSSFQWPENYCSSPDSRLNGEISDYGALLAKALLVAIENDDRELMHFAFDALAKVPNRHNAALVGSVIPLTAGYAEQRTRIAFLQELPRLAYYSVGIALAREYSQTSGEHQELLNSILKKITSADPPLLRDANYEMRQRRWLGYFSDLKRRRREEDPGLFTTHGLMNAIHQPPCDKLNIGWNRRWREARLPN